MVLKCIETYSLSWWRPSARTEEDFIDATSWIISVDKNSNRHIHAIIKIGFANTSPTSYLKLIVEGKTCMLVYPNLCFCHGDPVTSLSRIKKILTGNRHVTQYPFISLNYIFAKIGKCPKPWNCEDVCILTTIVPTIPGCQQDSPELSVGHQQGSEWQGWNSLYFLSYSDLNNAGYFTELAPLDLHVCNVINWMFMESCFLHKLKYAQVATWCR